jgi:hypothetical protein
LNLFLHGFRHYRITRVSELSVPQASRSCRRRRQAGGASILNVCYWHPTCLITRVL